MLPPSLLLTMIFKVRFLRSDAVLFEPGYEWLPVCAHDRDEAVSIFNKYLGIPYNYNIIDVSVLEYEDE